MPFNRTNVELKLTFDLSSIGEITPFNRTNVELKQASLFSFDLYIITFNRTNVELKPCLKCNNLDSISAF